MTGFSSVRVWAYGLAVLMGCVAVLAFGKSLLDYYEAARKTVRQTQHQSEVFAHSLSQQFETAQALIDTRLPALAADPTRALAWLESLRDAVVAEKSLAITSFGIAFEPYAYQPDQRLFAPMYVKASLATDAVIQLPNEGADPAETQPLADRKGTEARYDVVSLHHLVDYTRPYDSDDPEAYDSRWYLLGLNAPADRGVWQQPYYGEILQSMLSEYSRPFYGIHPVTGEREKLGMVYLDLSLADVRETVQNLELPAGAYGVLLSDQAYVVSHPIRGWLGKSLSETLSTFQPELAQTMTEKVALGESFTVTFRDPRSAQAFTAIHSSIPANQWSFGLTLAQDGLYDFTAQQRLLVLLSFFALGLCLLAACWGKASGASEPLSEGWRMSYLAVTWAVGMSVLTLGLFVPMDRTGDYQKLLNPTDLRALEAPFKRAEGANATRAIPTGVSIEDIRFLRHDEITVSGLVWQVVGAGVDDAALGIRFSRNQFDKTKMKKVFETERQGNTVHGWRFSTTMRHQTDVGQYPFDKSLISLSVTPKNRQTNVVLVPDFKAYDLMVPSSLPGIDASLNLKYWSLHASYFAKLASHPGVGSFEGIHGITVSDDAFNNALLFNVELNRKWLSPIVAYVLPIFIGSIMIFIVLMIPHDRSSGVVFSTLSYGSTIYFVISIFHVGLRNSEGIDGLTYLESYYIIMHAMVMLVSLNGFLLMINKGPSWLFYRDNAVPRMLYWPTITLGLLIMTLIYFAAPSFWLLF